MSGFSVTSIARHPPAIILRKDSSVKDAVRMMAEKSVRHALVSDDCKRLDGVISAKDILNYLGGGDKFELVKSDLGGDIGHALDSPIASVMNRAPVTGFVDMPLPELMSLMAQHDIGMLPLLDRRNVIWGGLSERHLFKLFEESQMFVRVSEIMSKPLITMDGKGTILDAMRMMVKNDIRRIPVMNEGNLWGIVTVKDVIRFLASRYVEEVISRGFSKYLFNINVSKIATTNPRTAGPDEDLSDAVKTMNLHDIGSLIIVSGNKPIGMLTERDFLLKLPRLRGVEFITDISRNRVLVGRIHF